MTTGKGVAALVFVALSLASAFLTLRHHFPWWIFLIAEAVVVGISSYVYTRTEP